MHYVNENNDDVFRRAAKDYPLNTDSADWNKVAAILHPDEIVSPQKNGRKYRWLLLLLPFAPLCNRYLEIGTDDATVVAQQVKTINHQSPFVKATTIDAASSFSLVGTKDVDNNKRLKTAEAKLVGYDGFSSAKNLAHKTSNSIESFAHDGIDAKPVVNKKKSIAFEQNLPLTNIEILPLHNVEQRLTLIDIAKKTAVKKGRTKFFAGIEASAGATTVKFQKTKGPNFDFGVSAGYNLSPRFSVEAALLSSKKLYHADGNTFNTAKIYVSPNVKLTAVDGACRMFELPLAVRFNFPSTQKKQWFVSAGVSNFFMQQEDYDYAYIYLASGQSAKRSKTYKNASKEWLANAQFSGGVLYDLTPNLAVKAEPYVQLPLKGIGTGQLPLTNAGLRVGIIKKLF